MIQHNNIPVIVPKGKPTIGTVAEEWLMMVEKTRKYSTFRKYFNIYHLHIASQFSAYRLNSIKNETVNHYLTKQALGGGIRNNGSLSDSTLRSIQQVLNQIFKYANQMYGTNIAKASFYHYQNSPKRIKVLSDRQCADLLKFLLTEPDNYKLGIVVCLYTGLRLGEICALKWKDFDWKQKLLYIHSTVQRIQINGREGNLPGNGVDSAAENVAVKKKMKTQLIANEPKSSSSVRYIPLPDELACLLEAYRGEGENYVLAGERPAEPRTYQYKFSKYLEYAGVEKTNFHILRHTFATKCIQSGFDIKCLSEILGHSNVQITMNRYVHPTLEMKRSQMNLVQFFS